MNNNEIELNQSIEKLESVFSNILYLKPEDRIITPTINNLNDLKTVLNMIFDQNKCIDILYTLNTDKQFFGVRVNPLISSSDAADILMGEDEIRLEKYQIEFDSKLFDMGLSDSELAAITLYEVSNMIDCPELFEKMRAVIDYELITNDDVISIRDSVNYAQMIIFAIKDTMIKMSSMLYVENPDDLVASNIIIAANLEESIITAKEKITTSLSGMGDTLKSPKPIVLQWTFLMYREMKVNATVVNDTLNDAKNFSGSKLEIAEIDKVLSSINKIGSFISEGNIIKFLDNNHISSLNESSLFKSLKKNGLKGIENELYEYNLRVKKCNDQDEALLCMRGINNRIGILEDYVATEELSDKDIEHWQTVIAEYKELRNILLSKKLDRREISFFVDTRDFDKLEQ